MSFEAPQVAKALERFSTNQRSCVVRYKCPDGYERGLRGRIYSFNDEKIVVERPHGDMVTVDRATVLEIVPDGGRKREGRD